MIALIRQISNLPRRKVGRSLLCTILLGLAGMPALAQATPPPAPRSMPPPAPPQKPPPKPKAPPAPVLDPALIAKQLNELMKTGLHAYAEFDPPVIAPGGHTTYRVVITAISEAASLPERLPVPKGLSLIPAGQGMSYAGVNNMVQPRTSFNFRATASALGTYTLPAYSVVANGKTIQVPARQLVVAPAANVPPVKPVPFRVELPPGDVYIGQAVSVKAILEDTGEHTVQGLSQVEVKGESILQEPTIANLRILNRQEQGRQRLDFIHEALIYPTREGSLTIWAQGHTLFNRPPRPESITLPSFAPLIESPPVKLRVRHVPKPGQLPGFTGAIGQFQLGRPWLSSPKVAAGSVLTLVVTVRGKGNLAHLVPPKAGPLSGWQMLPPQADATPPAEILKRGWVAFRYPLVPLTDQIHATPTISFCAFNPARHTYTDLTIPSIPLHVTAAPGGAVLDPGIASGQEDPDLDDEKSFVPLGLAAEPGPIHPSLLPWHEQPWFLALQLIPAALLAALWCWDRRLRTLARHPEIRWRARARRGARRCLRHALKAAARGEVAAFVGAAALALREAATATDGSHPRALVASDVLRRLSALEREGAGGVLVSAIFSTDEALRFSRLPLLDRQESLELLTYAPALPGLVSRLLEAR